MIHFFKNSRRPGALVLNGLSRTVTSVKCFIIENGSTYVKTNKHLTCWTNVAAEMFEKEPCIFVC